jgi:hypothetical protein
MPFALWLAVLCGLSRKELEENMASHLDRDYTGHIRDAQSSVPEDKEAILREIRSNEEEEAVDDAIDLLRKAGMSTPALQNAAARGVVVRGAANFHSRAGIFLNLLKWWCLIQYRPIVWQDYSCGSRVYSDDSIVFYIGMLIWVTILFSMPKDSYVFSNMVLDRFMAVAYVVDVLTWFVTYTDVPWLWLDKTAFLTCTYPVFKVSIFFILLFTAAGVDRVSYMCPVLAHFIVVPLRVHSICEVTLPQIDEIIRVVSGLIPCRESSTSTQSGPITRNSPSTLSSYGSLNV